MIRVVHALQPFPSEVQRAIFLAGPTPRESAVPSWRPGAIAALEAAGFDGHVFVPEPKDGVFRAAYDDQIDWELEGLRRADAILFWIPRDLEHLPGFTTNVEFGAWVSSGRAVLGAPTDAPKLKYLRALAHRLGALQSSTLEGAIARTIELVGEGAHRRGAECQLPAQVFRDATFQRWLAAQRGARNLVESLTLEWTLRARAPGETHGARRERLFLWVVRAAVYIQAEGRTKRSEVVLGRPDAAAVVLLRRRDPIEHSEVALVREFRTAASGADGYVHELPGGSAFDPALPMREVALEEVREEVGFALAPERLRPLGDRQLLPTLSAHRAHAFVAELDEAELDALKGLSATGEARGAGGSERTFLEIWRVEDVLRGARVDWSTVGMIAAALATGAAGVDLPVAPDTVRSRS